MPAFLIPNRSQMLLLTQVDLSTVAAEGSAVRIIDDLVDSLTPVQLKNPMRWAVTMDDHPSIRKLF